MGKYAQIDFDTYQMQGRPKDLPTRWTTSTGATINNFNLLPNDALYGLGWVPVVYEEISDPATYKHALAPTYDAESKYFVYAAEARDVDILKSAARRTIDNAAGEATARHISTGAGQEMRYLVKKEEAEAITAAEAAGEEVNGEDFPILAAEAAALGESISTRAATITEIIEAWTAMAAKIEAARIGGKSAVDYAADAAGVVAARDNAVETLGAL